LVGRGEMVSSQRATRHAPPGGDRRNGGVRAPRAYDGFQRERLGELQRARIVGATFDVVCERGAGNVSVAHVVERSGVSRRTFYEQFVDREDCLLAAFEQALASVSERVSAAFEAGGASAGRTLGWRERIRMGLVALLSFLDEEPSMGRVLIAESLACGPRVAERRARVLARVTNAIDEGRTLKGTGSQARSNGAPPLATLTNPLMGMIVLPYLGRAASRRELERPLPTRTADPRDSSLVSDPFKDTGMRLTYRTVRALLAVAEHDGASNRQVGESAGVPDQGQISKLLGRLHRIGLVSNTGLGPGQGAPNAWRLTEKGRQLTDSIRAHTSTDHSEEGM
jgi:AcrR family transcriptional regulator